VQAGQFRRLYGRSFIVQFENYLRAFLLLRRAAFQPRVQRAAFFGRSAGPPNGPCLCLRKIPGLKPENKVTLR